MKKLLLLFCLLLTPALSTLAATPQAHVLTRAEFDALLQEPKKLLLIDVRRPDEVTSIGGFPVYLSVQIKDLASSLEWIPKGRVIVTVSNHAARAAKAAEILAANGYRVAGAVGAETYEKDGGTLTKIVPPAKNGPEPSSTPTQAP